MCMRYCVGGAMQWPLADPGLKWPGQQHQIRWVWGGGGGCVLPPARFGAEARKFSKIECFKIWKIPISYQFNNGTPALQAEILGFEPVLDCRRS